jgi:hypothetical protein
MSEIPISIAALGGSYARLWAQFSEFPTRIEVAERIHLIYTLSYFQSRELKMEKAIPRRPESAREETKLNQAPSPAPRLSR